MDIKELSNRFEIELAKRLYDACVNETAKYLCVVMRSQVALKADPFAETSKGHVDTVFFVSNKRSAIAGGRYISLKKIRGIIIRNNIKSWQELINYYVAKGAQQ